MRAAENHSLNLFLLAGVQNAALPLLAAPGCAGGGADPAGSYPPGLSDVVSISVMQISGIIFLTSVLDR